MNLAIAAFFAPFLRHLTRTCEPTYCYVFASYAFRSSHPREGRVFSMATPGAEFVTKRRKASEVFGPHRECRR